MSNHAQPRSLVMTVILVSASAWLSACGGNSSFPDAGPATDARITDTSAPAGDGQQVTSDGSQQHCAKGPCCDPASGTFRPATVVCQQRAPELRCQLPNGCGSMRQRRTVSQHCSGVAAICDGAVSRGDWTDDTACAGGQRCAGHGVCTADPTCAATSCSSGLCCDPATKTFRPLGTPCSSTKEYTCGSTGCGAARTWRDVTRSCSGASADCDGAATYSPYAPAAPCSATETCSGSGACAANAVCKVTKPAVNVTPLQGPRGTLFDQPGFGFTPGGKATLYFNYPDGKVTNATKIADAQGSFSHSWATSPTATMGTYKYWAIDAVTGVKSNTVLFKITIDPAVSVAPSEGPRGTVFVEQGTDFTPGGQVTLVFNHPDGKQTTATKSADAAGSFAHNFVTGPKTLVGSYTYQAIDVTTGIKSNSVTLVVTINPEVSVAPTSGPRGTVFAEPGAGFTPGGTVTLNFLYPSGKVTTASKVADALGSYVHTFNTSAGTSTGTYTYWSVDDTTGIQSNKVTLMVLP